MITKEELKKYMMQFVEEHEGSVSELKNLTLDVVNDITLKQANVKLGEVVKFHDQIGVIAKPKGNELRWVRIKKDHRLFETAPTYLTSWAFHNIEKIADNYNDYLFKYKVGNKNA